LPKKRDLRKAEVAQGGPTRGLLCRWLIQARFWLEWGKVPLAHRFCA